MAKANIVVASYLAKLHLRPPPGQARAGHRGVSVSELTAQQTILSLNTVECNAVTQKVTPMFVQKM